MSGGVKPEFRQQGHAVGVAGRGGYGLRGQIQRPPSHIRADQSEYGMI
jgi:hypothetical protein